VDARRSALDSLAVELARSGRAETAREARRIAWSRAVPDEAGVRALLKGLRDPEEEVA
jgi:hypothetical protein